uniref:Cyclic nucleotide-binding domain-containing protein n=1 Tax=Phytophthora ramorum TaxID=164328 RepID=H3HCB7_PHYRM
MAPKTPTTPKGRGKGRGRGQISIVKVTPRAKTPLISSSAAETKASADEANVSTTAESEKQGIKLKGFSRAAHSIMTMHKQQRPTENVTQPPTERKDPWAAVMNTVAGKASRDVGLGLAPSSGAGATSEKRISLAQMLKSREMKNLVEQALVAKQSRVMSHWIKLSTLRRKQNEADDEGGDGGNRPNSSNNEEEEESETWEDANGVHSGFDLDDTAKGHQLYGRTLILEESCRRALAQDGEQRSQMDLQSLGVWFQTTKLKITTDFERLQPSELDLLCKRMTCVSFHPDEIIFRQGDEGDALYIVFSGTVEVRVSQRILGEVVEVTVCELGKGDYFGERSLLNNDVRAATVLSKTATDLVRITRNDYNLMLKNDQLEFLSRMQIANGIGVQRPVQRTQREYIKVLTKKKHARSKADIDMLSEYLQTLKFFRSLPKAFVRELCTVVDFQTLLAGACVFREGEIGDLFYIIFSGSVDVNINSKDFKGNMQMTKLVNLTEGSHFGELALMKGRGVRSATVVTREECQLLVICEKDYNATLRRMQKKDMAKRVGVLDQIPMFQTPEWTGELLKELSYVLLEQKVSTGSVLYRQGDRATHVYFVVRGEVVVTKEITDPFTQVKHEVFVERIGRFHVFGDDAAAGTNFNEVLHREVTALVPANELLLLAQEAKAMKKCLNPDRTLGNYVTSFNVDAPPSSARQRQLDGVLVAENRRQAEVLKEGNPLAFFDIKVVEKQIGASWNRTTKSLNGVEECDTNGPSGGLVPETQSHSPSRLNVDRIQTDNSGETDYVLFGIMNETSDDSPEAIKKSPAFQILQSARSLFAAREAVERLQEDDSAASTKYYVLPFKTFALMPRADRSKIDEERLQSSFATPRKKTSNQAAANSNSIRNTFAVASVVLSKLEVAHSQYEEPFVAVHALFSSEMEAVTHAMSLKPAQLLKSAMLRLTLVPEPPQQPTWQQERDEAKRLHNFICARMGAPVPDKKKDRTEESGGFTPQPLVSLENKLDTLHNYLQATAAFTSRTGHGGVALLKYRQVKRFGSIMRSRIAGTLPHSNNNSGGNNNSSLSPRTSFSTVVPG